MNIIYKTSAVSTGGRDGKVVVENSPSELGTRIYAPATLVL